MGKSSGFSESAKKSDFLILYGSQTGQAESIAENLVQQASSNEFTTHAFPLNDVKEVNDLVDLPCLVVIITSTTGDGEPPENADRFWRKIRRRNLSSNTLESFKYALLGLGDTNYNQFCNCGKEIHKRLQELGASIFYSPGWADDAIGLELVVEDWIDGLWVTLENLIRPESSNKMSAKQEGGLRLPICPPISLKAELDETLKTFPIDLEEPIQPYPLIDGVACPVSIIGARHLTKSGSTRTTLELTMKFKNLQLLFEPGDAIGIVCQNSSEEVRRLIQRLKFSEKADKVIVLSVKEGTKGKIPVFICPGTSFRQMLTYHCDIRSAPKKTFLRLLAEYTTDEDEKNKLLELCSREGANLFETTIRFPGLSLLDILLTFPSCFPPMEALIEHLPRLIPRAYSISSSPLQSKESFTIAFNVITFSESDGRKYSREGVCTGWLHNMSQKILRKSVSGVEGVEEVNAQLADLSLKTKSEVGPQEIYVYRRKNHFFRLPQNLASPIILVGPGTGIAPFIGFAQHRHEQKKKGTAIGEIYMYFGCRNKSQDFLYENELTALTEDKVITKLYTSFSRDPDQEDIKYVQHNMEKNKDEVADILLNKEGYIYVCGDAKNMAKNVRESLTHCIEKGKGIPEDEAKALVTELVSSKRYLQDVWS